MKFDFNKSIAVLNTTAATLKAQLGSLPIEWTNVLESEEKWSVFDVVGHLVHGEKTDWIERAKIILSDSTEKVFTPFDRFAQERDSKGKSLNDLLDEFEDLREKNIQTICSLINAQTDFNLKGVHPALGEVTLRQLISTWVVHDLGHLAQINRIMAKQYKQEVGPWADYMPILSF